MAELRLENLSKIFPGKLPTPAVQDLSLMVQAGECIALLGPSGAGKSTILRLIAGLEKPTAGQILIDGQSVENTAPGARELSMAFQYPALLPQLTVDENLRLGPRLRRQKNIDRAVVQTAELLGITPLLSRKPETLSGGEQQRVALGRALVAKPRVLLLDEPLASLDPLARIELREVIRRIQHELRLTTVYVTHDQAEAAAVADRIALLRDGTLQQFATAREMYLNPRNLFVAQFFGPDGLNLLRTTVSCRGGQCYAEVDAARFQLPAPPIRTTGQLAIAFRPSSVRVSTGEGAWRLKERRDLGWGNVLVLKCGPNEITVHQSSSDLCIGDSASVQINPNGIHVLDLASGERLL